MRPGELDFLTPVYKRKHTRESLIEGLDAIVSAERIVVSALPFHSLLEPREWLHSANNKSRQFSEIQAGDGVSLFDLSGSKWKADKPNLSQNGHFFIYDHPEYQNVHVLVTLEPSPFFELLRRLVESSFPKTLTTFVTHRRFQHLLDAFSGPYTQLIINRASFRVRFEEKTAANRRQIVPMVSWPEMDISRAFEWVYEQNGWFQSLKFTAFRERTPLAEIFFSRQGQTRTSGLFKEVFTSFVVPVCKIIDENVRFFAQRSRRDRKDLSVRPLVIDFETDQVAETEDRRRLIQAMGRMKAASVSVLHGNPYVHLSVLDYYDGSVFDVWVLSPNAITIVPQMKGSVAAIKRIINHIFDSYAEGRIREYQGPAA